ncbi:uncharacterized protein Dsimw501_GD28549 [Drosophila simulans]|uniref:Uncharacterized protein n=1 Tax=Drosophila simulans TaxID=7240 RepID=A0A0J9RKZ7_DROSI|nr:uncharacterized protein Dsimw501_GD28549 [Drosophila simulans]
MVTYLTINWWRQLTCPRVASVGNCVIVALCVCKCKLLVYCYENVAREGDFS